MNKFNSSPFYDVNALKQQLHSFRVSTIAKIRRQVEYEELNERQKIAHNMILSSCLQDPNVSRTDGGSGIGRLQMLLGEGGCGRSFVIDAVITSLKCRHNWNDDNFSIYATTGKAAATSVGGSTFLSYVSTES